MPLFYIAETNQTKQPANQTTADSKSNLRRQQSNQTTADNEATFANQDAPIHLSLQEGYGVFGVLPSVLQEHGLLYAQVFLVYQDTQPHIYRRLWHRGNHHPL